MEIMKVVIDENTEDYVIKNILTESFYPTTEKVLLVKDYLDKNFAKTESDDIGKDGYPVKIKTANRHGKIISNRFMGRVY